MLGKLMSGQNAQPPVGHLWSKLRLGGVLLAFALLASASGPVVAGAGSNGNPQVSGAGRTIIEGGTGGASPVPVMTVLAFHANSQGGAFECLALAPAASSGDGSGRFEVNAMYVTGTVSSVVLKGNTAILKGNANVTGLGAGTAVPFTATVKAGGPGTTVTLEISNLTFHEILLEGQIRIGD
jgi:hypothetical protein